MAIFGKKWVAGDVATEGWEQIPATYILWNLAPGSTSVLLMENPVQSNIETEKGMSHSTNA
jgi:hypothetical protein